MKVTTYEVIVEDGQIKLSEDVRFPDQTKVYVVVPGVEGVPIIHMRSPRLAEPWRAGDFVMEVSEDR